MKKWIVRILLAVLVFGAFAAVGFIGYRVGLSHGAQFSGDVVKNTPRGTEPFHRGGMPNFQFGFQGRDFERGFQEHGFQMRHRGGFGFMPPFIPLVHVALLGLIIWFAYKMFKGNGWTLSLTRVQPIENLPVETEASKKKSAKKDT
jgi:hypothetical protein